ncbi:MAG TPA: aromatic-ring-hydroxylating dioxygenase subunit beta, partial [Candidatus Binataceae bacterium]|nr:aromatic-ring-hydroxylating dioxygenase subunit beta [Candidatus Binataceae bacterium]
RRHMPDENESASRTDRIEAMLHHYEVERFYYDEAALLDSHRYEEWLALFSDDAHYFMPIRRTRSQREIDREFTRPGEIAFFSDDKKLLAGRILKLKSGRSWAEDPPSRTRHLITNIRIVKDEGRTLEVESNFHVYRTRLNSEETSWIGCRRDVLRRLGGSFQIADRKIFLEQTVLLSRNLSNFF